MKILLKKSFYLIVDDGITTTVYRDDKDSYRKPFQNFFNGNVESLKYSPTQIIKIFNNKSIREEKNKEFEKILSPYPKELQETLASSIKSNLKFPTEIVCNNPYEFKLFLESLEKNGFANEFNKDFLYKNPILYKKMDERAPEFGIVLESTLKALKEHSITEKNKIDFNDGDNAIWKKSQYVIFTEQNFSWVAYIKDRKKFTVYAAVDQSNGHASKVQSLSGLLKAVKSKEVLDDVDYVALRVENGKTQYANNAFMYSLDFAILFNKDVLEEEGLLTVDYDAVDVKSYDYQFAYVNQRYGYSKTSFLIHSLFVMGNGYSYDKENGRLFTDVKYIPGLLENLAIRFL